MLSIKVVQMLLFKLSYTMLLYKLSYTMLLFKVSLRYPSTAISAIWLYWADALSTVNLLLLDF